MSTSNGEGNQPHFGNSRFEQVVVRFQKGDPDALNEIVELSQRRALTLIRFHGSARYCSESELLSDINFKLIKAVAKFDPSLFK